MSTVRIKRTYAEWLEDAISVEIPDGAVVTEDDLRESFEDLYAAGMTAGSHGDLSTVTIDTEAGEAVEVTVSLEWENEHRTAVESLDDEIEVER